jgi:hypothetical protein
MRRPQGYATIFEPDKPLQEIDTFTCGHCNRVEHVQPRCKPEDLGGLCKQCMKLVCPRCNAIGICDVFEKKLERIEARDRFLRQAGL